MLLIYDKDSSKSNNKAGHKMMQKYKWLPLLLWGLCIIKCDPETTKNEFIYPLSIGNSWEYQREWIQYLYTDTLETKQYDDTLTYSSQLSVSIPRKLTLKDSIETYEMIATEILDTSTFNPVQNQATGVQYYKNNSNGLFIYAYQAGGPLVLPKSQKRQCICFKGLEFNSYRQLSDYVQSLTPVTQFLDDSIRFEEPPVKILPYPLKAGKRWTYRATNDPWRMDKLVEKKKEVELAIGTFDCYEVKFIYDMDNDGEWDDDIWITDYISAQGLILREITVLGMVITTIDNPAGSKRMDATDIYTLTDFSL